MLLIYIFYIIILEGKASCWNYYLLMEKLLTGQHSSYKSAVELSPAVAVKDVVDESNCDTKPGKTC